MAEFKWDIGGLGRSDALEQALAMKLERMKESKRVQTQALYVEKAPTQGGTPFCKIAPN